MRESVLGLELDEVLHCSSEPAVEGWKSLPKFVTGLGIVVHDEDLRSAPAVPAGHVVVVLPPGKRNQNPFGIPLRQPLEARRQPLAVEHEPWLQIDDPQLDHSDERSGIEEPLWQMTYIDQPEHSQ
jgi:hypothetical protein